MRLWQETVSCEVYGNLTICRANLDGVKRKIDWCYDCKGRRRFGMWFYEWYGARQICGNCGRRWEDGEWMPFSWPVSDRQDNIEKVRTLWRKSAAPKEKP